MLKKLKIPIIIIICICIFIYICFALLQYQIQKTQNIINLTTEQKISDFNTLCKILDDSYPFWNEIEQMGINKNDIYDTYLKNIENSKTDIEFFKNIGYFLNEFKGFGHLSVIDGYMYGLYIDSIANSSNILSEQDKKNIDLIRQALENPETQNTYSLLDKSHSGFRSIIGLKEEYQNQDISYQSNSSQILTKIYDDKKAAYIKIENFQLSNYEDDKLILDDFFVKINDIPNLIIDLRGNSGGSDLYWENLLVKPIINENLTSSRYFLFNESDIVNNYVSSLGINSSNISSLPEPFLSQYKDLFTSYTVDTTEFKKSETPYNGNIFILVDDKVYSSSENFVMFCKNTGFATLIGTTTNGDGGIADPMLFSLPNSGLIVRFSVFYGLNQDGSGNEANGTIPDIAISENEDALEKCLEIINM